MKKHSMKVALKISKLTVAALINKARVICDSILSNPATFVGPNPAIATVQTAADDLEIAATDAADGGKTKTAIMRDKQDALMKLLYDLAHYVESVANGDTDIVHLASMQTKQTPVFHFPDFSVELTEDHGSVRLRVKPRAGVNYKWEYCKDPMITNPWQTSHDSTTSTTTIDDLEIGTKYWFRVWYTSKTVHSVPFEPVSIIVT